jgi:hypothetical protein
MWCKPRWGKYAARLAHWIDPEQRGWYARYRTFCSDWQTNELPAEEGPDVPHCKECERILARRKED